jgi:4-hydroxy-2-oxoheptanedioate aldolase
MRSEKEEDMPRVNRVIELLEQDQPVFATGASALTHEAGVEAAQTRADFFIIDFEHNPFDMAGLRAFMRGLVDGGPTRSGHRTPPVIPTLPVLGTSAEAVRANTWQINHLLAAGVHGLLLCHAETPEAVAAFVSAVRYPFNAPRPEQLDEGRRGGGGQQFASEIWGLPVTEYMAKSDPWPLNPEGELLLGLKVENKRALANRETILAVPGLAFAEWGPGDMGMSLAEHYLGPGYQADPDFAHDPPYGPKMQAAQQHVFEACQANGVVFYSTMRPHDWRDLYALGARMSSSTPRTGEFIDELRRLAGRTMPV